MTKTNEIIDGLRDKCSAMEEKTIKSGEITEHFRYWMTAKFGFDNGRFVLVHRWVNSWLIILTFLQWKRQEQSLFTQKQPRKMVGLQPSI